MVLSWFRLMSMTERYVAQWASFGREVRRHRTHAGLSLEQTARSLTITAGMLSKIERAARPAKRDTAEQLDHALGTGGALLRAWSDANRRSIDPTWFARVNEAEARAVSIRAYHPSVLPGTVQTPAYARVVWTNARPLDTPEEIEGGLQLRAKRSARLITPGDPSLTVIVPEAVLRQDMGDPGLMAEQYDHIVEMAESGLIALCVLADGQGSAIGASVGPFRVVESTDRLPIVYAEHAAGGEIIDRPREVARFLSIVTTLTAWGLSPKDSVAKVKEIRRSCNAG
ncbi:helix-turn-helix domain-containing protein [Nocardiopsis sediminis]|uniref:Helix-turn-helix domain-containing protein n=1 Tax=Nocardiopsis sediminis TaxID=1778267 RepID=A0ABV8FP71_9ACTN